MGYLGSNASFTGTQNNKRVSVIATQGQTLFTVSGGYAINAIDVYRNGVKLSGQRDFTALDGASVTLVSAANADDILEFVTFENFQREDVVTGDGDSVIKGNLQVNGNLDAVNGTLTATNLNVSGIYTATQFDGNITGTAATFTGNVTVGGTLTYDDVTNIDSIGLITARSGVSIADSIFHTGDTNTAIRFPAADTITAETGGSERLRILSTGRVAIGTESASSLVHLQDGDNTIIHFGNESYDDGVIQYNNGSFNIKTGSSTGDRLLTLQTAGSERMRITSGGGIHFNNGELIERAKVTAGKLSDNTSIDLEDGMAHLFTTTETTTATPNIRVNSSTTLNSVMATGDAISVSIITTAAAAGYSAQLTIDGAAVTEKWNGGSAPSAGGASGNDLYSYTIIKTGDATYTVLANVANFA